MAKTKKKKGKKAKKLSSAEKLQLQTKRAHFRDIRSIFATCGFKRVASASDKEFTYDGTTSDFDDVLICENIVVLSECTIHQSSELSNHLKKKKVLYDKVQKDIPTFLDFMDKTFPDFLAAKDPRYQPHHFRVVIVYCARNPISTELKEEVPGIKYLDYHVVRYFKAITDRVRESARYELFNFLGLSKRDIGANVISPAAASTTSYKGSILPEGQSHFPPGYKVVSFYVTPAALLERCYVLRKDGWGDDDGLYQRMISRTKVEAIRKYLLSKKRVFINNIIVTLPSNTQLTRDNGHTIDPSKITQTEPGNIQLPSEYNSIGLIDGQHRVFSYYEGGKDETAINLLRLQQNLLVTGIIYPQGLSQPDRSKFEATLFLEINATQTNARSDLKQAIGVLLHPFSLDSIARQVVNALNDKGALGGEFERYFFDKGKIKTTTIVSYGLKPIIKLGGDDSLFKAWTKADKQKLIDTPNAALVLDYVKFCSSEINLFISAIKANLPSERWTADKKVRGRMLTTTILNGFIVCLRLLVQHQKLHSFDWYRGKLDSAALGKFQFSSYKSSQYGSLGQDLYKNFFDK
ncbi:DGQHR domain-containing protein [Bradyrhizobium sp. HKCCYLS2033]|uniref:DGQHR domain-containing protein n=1 Tax=Bradyrhizobium sp. HKCCYLS2033 TaxID=3420739 RepID=UPI003EC08657